MNVNVFCILLALHSALCALQHMRWHSELQYRGATVHAAFHYVYIYIYIYIYMYIYIYTYIYIYVQTYICIHTYTHTYINICTLHVFCILLAWHSALCALQHMRWHSELYIMQTYIYTHTYIYASCLLHLISLTLSLMRSPTHALTLWTAIPRHNSTRSTLYKLPSPHIRRGLPTRHTRHFPLQRDRLARKISHTELLSAKITSSRDILHTTLCCDCTRVLFVASAYVIQGPAACLNDFCIVFMFLHEPHNRGNDSEPCASILVLCVSEKRFHKRTKNVDCSLSLTRELLSDNGRDIFLKQCWQAQGQALDTATVPKALLQSMSQLDAFFWCCNAWCICY